MVRLKDGRDVDLQLFKFDSCPFCVRVMRRIDELGIQGVRMRDTRNEAGAWDELMRVGGVDQVPCLFIDGKPMYESLDILRWLEENVSGAETENPPR